MSVWPPRKYSKYGLLRSYIECPATEAIVQRCSGSIAVTFTSFMMISPMIDCTEGSALHDASVKIRQRLGIAGADRRRSLPRSWSTSQLPLSKSPPHQLAMVCTALLVLVVAPA